MSFLNPYNISLDIGNLKTKKLDLTLMQNDNLYDVFFFRIFKTTNNVSNEIDYNLISKATVTFKLSNNVMIQRELTFDEVSRQYYYQIEDDVLQISSVVQANVQLMGLNNQRVSTNYFVFQVQMDNIDDDSFLKTNEFPILKQMVNQVTDILTKSNDIYNDGKTLDETLKDDISVGNMLDLTLKSDVDMIDVLHTTVNTLKTELETKIINAETKKVNLENIIATADLNTYASRELMDLVFSELSAFSTINVRKFGAKGDGITDDTQSIRDAINFINTLVITDEKLTLLFPFSTGYKTTETIIIPININVIMNAPVIYYGSEASGGLVIGADASSNGLVQLQLRVKRKVQSTWSDINDIGIKIYNANACNIDIISSENFYIGVQCIGSNAGFVYNNIRLSYIYNNKIGLDVTNKGTGWANQNNFLGGRFGVGLGINTNSTRYGVRITSQDLNYYNNNNVFVVPSFELQATPTVEGIPVLLEYSYLSSFLKIRNEGNSNTTIRITNNSTENELTTGYGFGEVEDLSLYPANTILSQRNIVFDKASNLIFSVTNIHKKACYYDGSTLIHVPRLNINGSSNANVSVSASGLTITDNYLEVASTRGMGIYVKTTSSKRFVIKVDSEINFGGRVNIRCYDINGNILDNTYTGFPHCKYLLHRTLDYSTMFGKCYRSGADSNKDVYFVLGEDVNYICVILSGGTSPLRLRGFNIFSLDNGTCSTWTGYEEIIEGANLGSTPPTIGNWTKGRRIINVSPTVGQPKAWVCTATGTPGTWISEGNL